MMMNRVYAMICLLTLGTGTLHAAYDPDIHVSKEQMDGLRSGAAALKRMPKLLREACIAEKLGLLFMPNGSSAYSDKEAFSSAESAPFFPVKKGARYVSSTGKLQDFDEALKTKRNPKLKVEEAWNKAKRAIYDYGEDAVFSFVKNEVTQLVQQTAKNLLHSMPIEYRCACLVQYTGWAYNKAGKNAVQTWRYVSRSSVNRCEGTRRQAVWNNLYDDALFTAVDGREYSYKQCFDTRGMYEKAWKKVGLCMELIGIKDVLDMVPEERDALKASYEKKVGEQAP